MITTEHECESGCGRPAPTTRACWDCVTHITDALAQVTQRHMNVLDAISRREEQPFTLRTQSTVHQTYGPVEPLNLGALALHQDLTRWQGMSAADWSQIEDAAYLVQWVPDCVGRVLGMVDGEKESRPTKDYLNYRLRNHVRPMPTRILVPWLRDLGFKVNSSQISTWANRGKIARVDSGPGHPLYSPVDVVRVLSQPRG